MKVLWICFGVITKFDYTMHFRVFSEGQGTEWKIFSGNAKISNIYLGCLKLLLFFCGGGGGGGEW